MSLTHMQISEDPKRWSSPLLYYRWLFGHGHFFRTHFQPPCSVLGMKSTNTTIAESMPLHSIPHMARRFMALAVTEPVSGGVSTSSKARASSMAKRVAWVPFFNGCGKVEVSNWGISSLPVKAGRKKQKPHQWLIMDSNTVFSIFNG